ncbi:hypothetical protein GLOIN_2v1788400 [Rhizophagus clarus]|uniref:Uncharacterized protein n=1 Tax=Rhizophagus clarus TaxID=94130 RepID=A0A8H3L5C1_9GLOM|nr:hypothetical protein GLOIN_2v1788400 [Rhizophagus clarus]
MRLFAIKYCNYCSLICADDKHKVPIGEGIAITSGVRNKPSLVPTNMELTSSDHNFTKLLLTPSNILRQYDKNIPEILLLYTDGGVSLQRDPMNDILEDIFKGKNTLEEIRSMVQKNKKLGLKLRNSIKIVQELLSEQTKQ